MRMRAETTYYIVHRKHIVGAFTDATRKAIIPILAKIEIIKELKGL